MLGSAVRESAVFFQAMGYLRVPALLAQERAEYLCDTACRIGPEAACGRVRWSPEKTRVDEAISYDPAFLMAATAERVVDAAELVVGPNIELVEDRHNHVSVYRAPWPQLKDTCGRATSTTAPLVKPPRLPRTSKLNSRSGRPSPANSTGTRTGSHELPTSSRSDTTGLRSAPQESRLCGSESA